ncbi:MAG: hypothetical protein IT379_21520, partial [Deltaproteobacteria bacterium]|nr:hypothetical protein [Deltaproteobacteria bacterium]
MSRASGFVCLAVVAAAWVGCGDDDGMTVTPPPQPPPPPDGGTPPPPPGVEAEWTVFVYGHADHNLSNSLVRDIQEMNRATIPDDMNVIVLADFDASQDIGDGGDKFPSGSALLRIVGGGAEPEELGTGDEEDLDSPDVLAAYVQDVFTQFPARRRGLIMWNHGGGWSGGFGGDTQDGTREGTNLPFQDAADAIASGLSSAGIADEPPLVFLSFDTCLMAGAEIAQSFRSLAELYVANAEIDYGDGWDYERALTMIGEQKGISADDLGREEVSIWDAHHASAGVNDGLLRSHVAIDLAQMDAFASAMSGLADVWLASEALNPADVGVSGFYALPPYFNQIESGSTNPGLRDLGQFLDRLGTTTSDPDVAAAASGARSALDSMILGSSQGSVRTAGRQSGVHTELSLASQLTSTRRSDFRAIASDWSQATGWADVLDALASYDDAQVP